MMGWDSKPRVSSFSSSISITNTNPNCSILETNTNLDNDNKEVNFYTQAEKSLTEVHPFDIEEGVVVISPVRVSTLPVALSDYISKNGGHNNNHKRHKRSSTLSHLDVPVAKAKTKLNSSSKGRVKNVWTDTEECFRPVELEDVQRLELKSKGVDTGSARSVPITVVKDKKSVKGEGNGENGGLVDVVVNVSNVGISGFRQNVEVGVGLENGVKEMEVEVEVKDENGAEVMDIDNVIVKRESGGGKVEEVERKKEKAPVLPLSCSDMPFLLGVRNKYFCMSERPNKKRKLMGSDAGLERISILCPDEGECHVCSMGDTEDVENKLLVCGSCNVVVHQKCYGVVDVPEEGVWLCSWCSENSEVLPTKAVTPCVLCSLPGGALKPVARDDDSVTKDSGASFGKFAHLVCAQWMPEVYVEDTRTMEPIMNVKEIKEARTKLICTLCKVKFGAGVRCTHGTCRTSFHPSCAREAKHRMEIWGKLGCDDVELRAFCLKHSEVQGTGTSQQSKIHSLLAADHDLSVSKPSRVPLGVHKPLKLKLGRKNEALKGLLASSDGNPVKLGSPMNKNGDTNSSNLIDLKIVRKNEDINGVSALADANLIKCETPQKRNGDNNNTDTIDCVQALQKLVDRGKVDVSDVAFDIGITSDLLVATLAGDVSVPVVLSKIISWLRSHAFMGSAHYTSENISKSGFPSRVGLESANFVPEGSPDYLDALSVKPGQLNKPTHNIRMKDNKVMCMTNHQNDNVLLSDVLDSNPHAPNRDLKDENADASLRHDDEQCLHNKHASEKISPNLPEYHELGSAAQLSILLKGDRSNGDATEINQADISVGGAFTDTTTEYPISSADLATPTLLEPIGSKSSFVDEGLLEKQNIKQEEVQDSYDSEEKVTAFMKAPSPHNQQNPHIIPCVDISHTSDPSKIEQLVNARKMGILEQSLEDEVEGQLLYFRSKLRDHVVASKRCSGDLMFRVIRSLPQELDIARKSRWDSVLVNQYLSGLKEAKKVGRKERKHKENQAGLAAANAAVASSSRISTLRKDPHDEDAHENLLKMNASGGRTGITPRAKESLSKLSSSTYSIEKHSDGLAKEPTNVCDICRKPETILSPIIICGRCKVIVHLVCYRNVKHSCGPWYCELCEEVSPCESSRDPPTNDQEKPRFVKCRLCGNTNGAFRKSTDKQWVHPFCAEWMLESTFRRGQPNLIEGMEAMARERENLCIFCRKHGICVKCNYGNCQTIFHPICARDAGVYMLVKAGGTKSQHKAYCEKHSLDQRVKAETQQHGAEDLKRVKQLRVELERVRLLCERIIRREKVKRDLVVCSHDMLAAKRDSVALSVLVHNPYIVADVSSESATTTSLRGHFDDNKSCSEAIQKSDDITVDSAISGKCQPIPMEIEQKIDEDGDDDDACKAPHPSWPRDLAQREPCAGKQLPHRPLSDSSDLPEDGSGKSESRRHIGIFSKEMVMTLDQAKSKNQRLPKGFAYVPVPRPNEDPADETGRVEPDG